MKIKKTAFIFVLILTPNLTWANLGDDINNIIDEFWGTNEELSVPNQDQFQFPDFSAEKQEIKKSNSEFPAEGNLEYINKIRAEIISAEGELQNFENAIRAKETAINEITSTKNSLETDLYFLDTQLNETQQRLKTQKETLAEWSKQLDKLSYDRSDIKARIRVSEEAFGKEMQKLHIRNETFSSKKNDTSLVKWLFSEQTVAEIIEERERKKENLRNQYQYLLNLNKLKIKLQNKEQKAALLFGRYNSLKQSVQQENKILRSIANNKAQKIENLTRNKQEEERQLDNYRNQQSDSTIYIQDLRQVLSESQKQLDHQNPAEKEKIASKKVLESPLKIEQKITATFKDAKYKKVFKTDHLGLDLFAPQNTMVYAPQSGIVKKTGIHGYGYSYLVIEHPNNLNTVYGHITKALVNPGQKIETGQAIAQTGGTPGTKGAGYFTTGPHLHFEVWKHGNLVNPLDYLK